MRSTFRRPPARRCCRCRPGGSVEHEACSCGTNERSPVRSHPAPGHRGSHPGDRTMLQLAALTLAVVALGAPATSPASTPACLTGTAGDIALDRQQLVDLRAAIDSACACPLFDGQPGRKYADYVRCGKQLVRDAFRGGALRQACVRTVNGYVKGSSCGTDPLLDERPCIRVRSGSDKVSCSIKSAARNECRGSDARPAAVCNGP